MTYVIRFGRPRKVMLGLAVFALFAGACTDASDAEEPDDTAADESDRTDADGSVDDAEDEEATGDASAGQFVLEEATVPTIHAAFDSGELTCEDLIAGYLDRIDAYEEDLGFNSIAALNDDALATATDLDEAYAEAPDATGALHCIPILLKDNFNTADMPTTSSSDAFEGMVPAEDAVTVAAMRDAGAVILGKTHMQEFARGGVSVFGADSLQVLNPYDLGRTPGGSSGGTGTAIAANFATLGTGSDTGQSIRSPASANSLVGVRPTRGLVARTGVAPNSYTQDEIGPITRTVEDAARLLEVMVGYDAADPVTSLGVGNEADDYLETLNESALEGARIGLMENMLGDEDIHQETNEVVEQAVAQFEELGAEVVYFSIEEYDELAGEVSTSVYEAAAAMEQYLQLVGENAPVDTLQEIVDMDVVAPEIAGALEEEVAFDDGMSQPEYFERTANRELLTFEVLSAMADEELDAILYPHQSRLVAEVGDDQLERNGTLSNGTGLPAVTFPGGFSEPTDSAPEGVPIGIELLGREFSEPQLLGYAYAFEQAADVRVPPASTPPLGED